MKFRICLGASCAIVAAFVAFKSSNAADVDTAKEAQIKHGQYIVERVGMCADCHTPRTQTGEFNRELWLQGMCWISSLCTRSQDSRKAAPPIAGLPTLPTDELAIRFLETGTNAAGKLSAPPMPGVRLNHEDAVAVAAYLRSLKK